MALSAIRPIFGIHQFSPYNRTTGEFYGTIKCLKSSSISLSGDLVKLEAGSSRFQWASESGKISAEMSLKFSEYPAFVFQLFLGKSPTEVTTPSTTGEVNNFANVNGSTIKDVSNGVSGVSVTPSTGAAMLKYGKYIVKATGSNTLDIYVSTDINFDRGTSSDYTNDLLKVESVTISGATNDSTTTGLRFTKVGTPAFTTGDTATFDVLPPYSKKLEVVIGNSSDVSPEFGAIVMGQKRGDLSLTAVDVFRAKASGMPIGFDEKAFSESEAKCDLLYDSAKGGVFKFMSINVSS